MRSALDLLRLQLKIRRGRAAGRNFERELAVAAVLLRYGHLRWRAPGEINIRWRSLTASGDFDPVSAHERAGLLPFDKQQVEMPVGISDCVRSAARVRFARPGDRLKADVHPGQRLSVKCDLARDRGDFRRGAAGTGENDVCRKPKHE